VSRGVFTGLVESLIAVSSDSWVVEPSPIATAPEASADVPERTELKISHAPGGRWSWLLTIAPMPLSVNERYHLAHVRTMEATVMQNPARDLRSDSLSLPATILPLQRMIVTRPTVARSADKLNGPPMRLGGTCRTATLYPLVP